MKSVKKQVWGQVQIIVRGQVHRLWNQVEDQVWRQVGRKVLNKARTHP
jgi:hypothetical protein